MTTKIEDPRAKRERMASEGAKAMADYLAEVEATNERTARLRAERVAREAATAAQPKPVAPSAPAKAVRVKRKVAAPPLAAARRMASSE
jgi:hypothetical protein